MNKMKTIFPALVIISLLSFYACGDASQTKPASKERVSKRAGINEVIVHELSDPDKLNPITSTGASATYIKYNIFMQLLDVDKERTQLNPSLAKELPVVTELTEGEYAGGLSIEYEIRPEAVWDNGEPVTAYDVEFTLKALKNPFVDAEHLRPYLDFIDHMEIDKGDPKKFTFYCKTKYFAADVSSGNMAYIAPEYVYDPEKIMRNFTLRELNDAATKERLRENPDIIRFANAFNSEKYQREPGFVVGCGPYTFESWTTGQRVILRKKKDWWGDALAGTAVNFSALPDKIIYEIVNDRTTAVTAMKDEGLDISRALREKDFHDVKTNDNFKQMFHLFDPIELSYVYIGLNMKHPVLSDVNVRKALAYAVDRKHVIDVLLYGMGRTINGPFNPVKPYYNEDIPGYDFDLTKARQLLDDAGWIDTDGDGIRDKVVNGKKEKLSFTFKYNSGNDTREKIGLFFKDNVKKIGVHIEILVKEWTVFLDETKSHNFDTYCLGWIQDPLIDDPKQIWHTDSYNGGSNNIGFGNEQTDDLIEAIRTEMDEEKRHELYREFQQVIYETVPYIFIYTPKARIVMNKRFSNARAYITRPGYTERELMAGSGGAMAAEN